MRKNAPIILAVIAIIYCFTGCNKIKDQWYPGSPVYQNAQKDFDLCRITEIHQSAGPLVRDRTGTFHYSSNGNLDSVVFDDGGIVHFWKYDDHNVLVEYRDAFDHDITDFRTLHKYASQNGRVIRDTTWLEGASGYIVQVWSLEYDNKGRVVRETGYRIDEEAPGAFLPDKVYSYDSQGNLVNGATYDNEVNFLRTNKVLQFVHRNYSVNNMSQFVLGYNEYHLPLGFRMAEEDSFLGGGTPTKLSYSCVPIPPVNQVDQCRLAYVKQISWDNTIYEGTFYYTPNGLPLSVQYTYTHNNFAIELNNHRFLYSKHNKLTVYQVFDGNYAYIQHSYGYSGNKITLDTLYSDFGEQFLQISKLQYDNEGRIIKEDIHVIERNLLPVSETITKQYVYDNRGNLVSPLVTTYDNKVNYLRTDPLWMFIHRNYSQNNPQGVTQYNSENLPLGFTAKVFGFLQFGEPAEIEYLCPESVQPGNK
jgi:hypothetical protein